MGIAKSEKLVVAEKIYKEGIPAEEAASIYGVSTRHIHRILREYKMLNGIEVRSYQSKTSSSNSMFDMEAYQNMTKEELINELILAKANELRAKKGYEVKGVGANKEFIPLNNKNSK